MLLRRLGQRRVGVLPELFAEAGELDLETAQAIVHGAQVELLGARPHLGGAREILRLDIVGGILDERVRVLCEPAARGEQQPLVIGRLRQQALDGLQPERHRGGDELGIVVGGKR